MARSPATQFYQPKFYPPIPFWGFDGHFPAWVPERDFYLVSAASLWWSSRHKFVKRSYPSPRTRMFLDSGGFSFFATKGDYPFSPDDYLQLVEHPYYGYQPLLWASLDYPCEPDTCREEPHKLRSNLDRITATIDYLDYFTRRATWPGMVPVVQGFTLDERLHCLEQMACKGLTKPFMAIGSLCAQKSIKEIDKIVVAVALAAQKMGLNVVWHLLGVKTSYLESNPIGYPFVFSFDTAAWGLGRKGETKNPIGDAEKQKRYFRYRSNVYRLLSSPRQLSIMSL